MMFASFQEAVYFRRVEGIDELWLVRLHHDGDNKQIAAGIAPREDVESCNSFAHGCVWSAAAEGDELSACSRLLDDLFHGYVGFAWPQRFEAAGMITEAMFSVIVKRLDEELTENKKKTQSNETEIIAAARELNLDPEPTGTGPALWKANCPGTTHRLEIVATWNEFFCGYCKRKGGVEELRGLVGERG